MFQLARKYDFHPARRAAGHWDPADNLQLSGPDPVSMADRSGNGRLLSYRSALGSATADTLNGLAAVRFPAAQNSFYSDSAGALVGAGTNAPFTVYGSFRLDLLASTQTMFTLDSAASYGDWITLYVNNSGSLSLFEKSAAGNLFITLSESLVAAKTYTYVLRRNANGTVDFWLNGSKIDTNFSFSGGAMAAITRFSVAARDLTSFAPAYALDGVFAASGIRGEAASDAWCEQAAPWLHQRYGGGALVHDFHIGFGQSNFLGQAEAGLPYPETVYGSTYVFNGNSEGICEANYRFEPNGKMNSNPGFAKKYYELSGRGSVWINAAVGNSALLQAADNGVGWWDPRAAGNIYDTKKILVDKMLAAAQASPRINAGRRVFHWGQGELDAVKTNGTTVTAALYEAALNALFDQAKIDFGIDIFGIYELGHDALDAANANWTAIRTAQQNVIAARADTYSFNSKAHETAPLVVDVNGDWVSGWGYDATNIHYTRDAYQAMGRLGADALNRIGPNLVLDAYPTTLLAGGLRLLKTGYAGACCQVRRASDSAVMDIGFVNGVVDSTSIASFCGVSDGFISVLYDQNQVDDFTQSSAADQPKIYDGASGSIVLNGAGNPAMRFDGNRSHLRTTLNPAVNLTLNMVLETLASDVSALPIWEGYFDASSTTKFAGALESGSTAGISSNAGTPAAYVDGVAVSPLDRNALYADLNPVANQTRVLGLETIQAPAWSGLQLFGYNGTPGSVWQYGGLMSEIVVWADADITTANFLAAAAKSRLAWA